MLNRNNSNETLQCTVEESSNQEPIYIFGHQSPDTDSICSAIAVADLKSRLGKQNYIPTRLGELNKETLFVLESFGIPVPCAFYNACGKNVVLVDHNEKKQSAEGVEDANILEIIDHHRIANLETKNPLHVTMEPAGSTASIVYKQYLYNNISPTKNIAGILLSALLSDTLILTSPTTTDEDKLLATALADIAGIDNYQEYGKEMLRKGSSTEGYTPQEILAQDRKEFNFGDVTAFVSQIITYDTAPVLNQKNAILQALREHIADNNSTLGLLVVTDLNINASTLIVTGKDAPLAHTAFSMSGDTIFLEGVVSRKTQIIPPLTEVTRK